MSEKVTEQTPAEAKQRKPLPIGALAAIGAGIAIMASVAGFAGGIQFQKVASNMSSTPQQGLRDTNRFGAGRMNRNGSFGEVTAISDSSITISLMGRPGSSSANSTKTLTINSSTKITVDGTTAKASDIKTGDTVQVTVNTSDSTVAASIRAGIGAPDMQQSADIETRTN